MQQYSIQLTLDGDGWCGPVYGNSFAKCSADLLSLVEAGLGHDGITAVLKCLHAAALKMNERGGEDDHVCGWGRCSCHGDLFEIVVIDCSKTIA